MYIPTKIRWTSSASSIVNFNTLSSFIIRVMMMMMMMMMSSWTEEELKGEVLCSVWKNWWKSFGNFFVRSNLAIFNSLFSSLSMIQFFYNL
jgi:hypothetical protein